MSERSGFFNSFEGDRVYTAAQFVEYFSLFIGNGIFWGGNYVKVNAHAGMDIKVEVGNAFINGYFYINETAPKTITVEPAYATKPRIDRVVLRLDLSQPRRLIFATVKKGEASDTPVPPELQRNNAVWEIALADIRVNAGVTSILQTNITDLRLNKELCGVVAGLVNQPDLTQIFNQYLAKYNELLLLQKDYEGWFSQIKAEIHAQYNTDFDDWSRRPGYTKTTEFLANGNITEKIVNTINKSILATRSTEFLANGNIKETLSFTEPLLTTIKTTIFNADGSISEVISA